MPGVPKVDDNGVDLTTVNGIQVRLQITDYRVQMVELSQGKCKLVSLMIKLNEG